MRDNNLVMQLIIGLTSLVLGLFLFTSRVTVSSGLGFRFGGLRLSGGLVIVPFIISLVWLILSSRSIFPKIATVLSVMIILASVISNTRFYFAGENLFNYLMIIAMIAIGAGLVIKVGLSNHY